MKEVDINTLKKGDEVYVRFSVQSGWSSKFRYDILRKYVVERITPKRTKVVLCGGLEFDRHSFSRIVTGVTKEDFKHSQIAEYFSNLQQMTYKFDKAEREGKFSLRCIEDEDIEILHKIVVEFYNKYLEGKE